MMKEKGQKWDKKWPKISFRAQKQRIMRILSINLRYANIVSILIGWKILTSNQNA